MALRRCAFDKMMVSAVVGRTVLLGMHRWSRSFEGQRSLLAVQEVLRPQGYACGTVDYSQLGNVVGIL